MLRPLFIATLLALAAAPGRAEPPTPNAALARMPVKEVTVFKDGHAYVVHEGAMPTDAAGNVLLDLLPTPVLGTFWPYSLEKNAKLESVTAARRRVSVERTALTIRELIEANAGAEVVVAEGVKPAYAATIVKLLTRSAEELDATLPPAAADHLPVKDNVLLLKTADGTRAVPIEQVTDLKFVGKYATTLTEVEARNLLTLKLDWGVGVRRDALRDLYSGAGGYYPPGPKPDLGGRVVPKSASVGMAYVQKGIRWIPNYRVELGEDGQAVVKLQATLLNELADLKDATVNLVVGVPSFHFKDTADPIALSQAVAQLSPYFQTDASAHFAMSNAMMTQVARGGEVRNAPGGAAAPAPDLGPAVGGTQSEDLFVYTVKNVTLARGQRMVLPVTQSTLAYKDVYTLDIPATPPLELRAASGNNVQGAALAKLMAAPKVIHKVRLTNGAAHPLTTAPVLVLKGGRVLAQGMMTYTQKLGSVDVALTAAVDIRVKLTEREVKRTPDALVFDKTQHWRGDLTGSLSVTNAGGKPVEVEVTRNVLGHIDTVGDGAKSEQLSALDDAGDPARWGEFPWPGWWSQLNGVGRVTWTAKLAPGQTAELAYAWHYFWR